MENNRHYFAICFYHRKPERTRINLYNSLEHSRFVIRSENLAIEVRDARRIRAAELKYMRKIYDKNSRIYLDRL